MAALRRLAARLPSGLARLSSTAAATQQQMIIPAEVAVLVCQNAPGLAVMPPDVVAAVDQAAADANRKSVKRRGTELTQRLRHMSRSKHRGGVHPNLTQQLAADDAEEETAAAAKRWQRRGKRRQTRNHFLDQLTRTPAMPVDVEQRSPPQLSEVLASLQGAVTAEEAAQAAAGREQSASRNSIADGGSLYDTPAALAYAASRMPACYAALEASLREVAARRPSWHPQNMLDFGAGPGTAVWAAQQVWRQQPLDALAVEPAGAMSWLGSEIQQRQLDRYDAAMQQGQGQGQQQFAGGAGAAAATAGTQQPEEEEGDEDEEPPAPPPRLRWMYKLPPRYRTASAVRQYDLVTAGYVLGELAGDVERRRLVAELWDRTADGGVLLLVEPGTPSGSGHVQKARAQLLEATHQQAQQAQQAQGAHVVAPCPHDGACPLESRPSWCHFVQRFQRTQLQRNAKAATGVQPRTYQDERYSYVAIAKAPRPVAHDGAHQPLIAGSFWPDLSDPQELLHIPANLVPRKVPADAMSVQQYTDGSGDEEEQKEEEADERIIISSSSSSDDNDGSEAYSSSSSSSSSSSDSEDDTADEEEAPQSTQQRRQAARGRARQQVGSAKAGWEEATHQLLLESIEDGDDGEEDDFSTELAAQLRQELALQRDSTPPVLVGQGVESAAGRQAAPDLGAISEATVDLMMDGEHVDWQEQEPEAAAAAQAASGGWSRVIRTPRKRSGHVVLDFCSAAPAQQAGGEGAGGVEGQPHRQEGVLLRQVISKAASRREAGGTAAYRLARRMRWGDLWPRHYQERFRADEAPSTHQV